MSKEFKPTRFVLHRDLVIGGTTGHAIEFKKGVPVHVPREMWAEVQSRGAIPEEDLPEEQRAKTTEPNDPEEREKMIFGVFEKMVLANAREDFAATGVPHGKALEKQLGFKVDNKERDALWQKFKQQDE